MTSGPDPKVTDKTCPDGCGCFKHRRKVDLGTFRSKTTWAVTFLDSNDCVSYPLLGESNNLNDVVELLEKVRETNPDAVCISLKSTTFAEFIPNDHLYGL